jgi:hypothetical protein
MTNCQITMFVSLMASTVLGVKGIALNFNVKLRMEGGGEGVGPIRRGQGTCLWRAT